MAEERKYRDAPATVTVGLTDGRTLVGRLGLFRPSDAELSLRVRERDAAGVTSESSQRLAAEHIAYVAIHRGGKPCARACRKNRDPRYPCGGRAHLHGRVW